MDKHNVATPVAVVGKWTVLASSKLTPWQERQVGETVSEWIADFDDDEIEILLEGDAIPCSLFGRETVDITQVPGTDVLVLTFYPDEGRTLPTSAVGTPVTSVSFTD